MLYLDFGLVKVDVNLRQTIVTKKIIFLHFTH